ncbi:hypothetical protein SXYLSMQ121_0492 [Staphylococcus xylosus]|nr:hypothetical protein SXYLSMQ121_0492 [Staphylococcus xylosus]
MKAITFGGFASDLLDVDSEMHKLELENQDSPMSCLNGFM